MKARVTLCGYGAFILFGSLVTIPKGPGFYPSNPVKTETVSVQLSPRRISLVSEITAIRSAYIRQIESHAKPTLSAMLARIRSKFGLPGDQNSSGTAQLQSNIDNQPLEENVAPPISNPKHSERYRGNEKRRTHARNPEPSDAVTEAL
jgi:hypothetical protein